MFNFRLRVKVGSALRPEDGFTPERIESTVEEIIALSLQTAFAYTEITNVDCEGYEEGPTDEPLQDERGELPEELL